MNQHLVVMQRVFLTAALSVVLILGCQGRTPNRDTLFTREILARPITVKGRSLPLIELTMTNNGRIPWRIPIPKGILWGEAIISSEGKETILVHNFVRSNYNNTFLFDYKELQKGQMAQYTIDLENDFVQLRGDSSADREIAPLRKHKLSFRYQLRDANCVITSNKLLLNLDSR
jgi:hypothetical protein